MNAELFNAKRKEMAIRLGIPIPPDLCGRPMVTYVWGDKSNPDYWNCEEKPGHKGSHRRYPKDQ